MSLVLIRSVNLLNGIKLFCREMKPLPHFTKPSPTQLFSFQIAFNERFIPELMFTKIRFFVLGYSVLACMWFSPVMYLAVIAIANVTFILLQLALMCPVSQFGLDIRVLLSCNESKWVVINTVDWCIYRTVVAFWFKDHASLVEWKVVILIWFFNHIRTWFKFWGLKFRRRWITWRNKFIFGRDFKISEFLNIDIKVDGFIDLIIDLM